MADPRWFKNLKWRLRIRAAAAEIRNRCLVARPHGLDGPLIVSLTSHPARFPVLHRTLRSVMNQTVAADKVVLTLTEGDEQELPPAVTELCAKGLEIRTTPTNIGSFTKLDACIATCDDDLYMAGDWLEGLVRFAGDHPGRIAAHRAHRILYDARGFPLSYENWDKNIDGAVEGPDIFATGVGGILYPPGSLDPMVLDEERFMRLCPHGDDLWFYWMARRRGTIVRHVGPKTRIVEWPGSQITSLRAANRGVPHDNGNDRAIAALINELGLPDSGEPL